jgi:hypothetical protein
MRVNARQIESNQTASWRLSEFHLSSAVNLLTPFPVSAATLADQNQSGHPSQAPSRRLPTPNRTRAVSLARSSRVTAVIPARLSPFSAVMPAYLIRLHPRWLCLPRPLHAVRPVTPPYVRLPTPPSRGGQATPAELRRCTAANPNTPHYGGHPIPAMPQRITAVN